MDSEKFTGFEYKDDHTREISFPLGGIGSGSIGLAGNGRLIDWEIFNRPNKGSRNGCTHIAVKAERNGRLLSARVLNGDLCKDFMGQYESGFNHGGFGYGPSSETMGGFPHFRDTVFKGTFPIAELTFAGEDFPADLSLSAFNPFIPLKEDDSSIPAAFFETVINNTSDLTTDYTVAYSIKNPFSSGSFNRFASNDGVSMIKLRQDKYPADDINYGDLTLATDGENVSYQEYWYRGGWSDAAETYWRNFTEAPRFKNRHYEGAGSGDTAVIAVHKTLCPGESAVIRFVLAWNMPNNYNYWSPLKNSEGKDVTWKNYYAVLFKNSIDSAVFSLNNWDRLYSETKLFRDTLYGSTLPHEVIDAAAANLSVLKSPTVLRLEDGSFYGWEGAREHDGSCEGSCTHVWNYAYAMAYLFPKLERSIRENDFKYNQRENGKMEFRMTLPAGREKNLFRACVDGQMGGIIKTYREWKFSGDTEWLAGIWPAVKRSLEYAWDPTNEDRWDPDKDGIIDGRQHHTLDMELFSPSSWLEGMYLAALKAAAEMAEALGDTDAADYRAMFANGSKYTESELFNGSYYIQKIDLQDKDLVARFDSGNNFWNDSNGILKTYWNEETGEIKYQIGEGSAIDQLLAQWHAGLTGLGRVFDETNTKTALKSIYKNNFREALRDHYNPFRLFGLNGESGTVICSYPESAEKPAIPVPYCQETMHGFEYSLAGLMLQEGFIEEGLRIVKAVRDRYDGKARNPWNEIECGNNYARSMASFALIPICSGFAADMTRSELSFDPIFKDGAFRSIWSIEAAWGSVELSSGEFRLKILGGKLPLRVINMPVKGSVEVISDGSTEKTVSDGKIVFDKIKFIENELVIKKI